MISIIISAFQDRGYLDEAILSAKNQIFDDYEIILSSDCNPGLKSYADKYGLRFILNLKQGHSNALNNAVSFAKGEWIKELHDDDILLPNCLKDLYNGRKWADLVYANAINFNQNGEELYKCPANINLSSFIPVITNPMHWPTVMFRKEAFQWVGGFDSNLSRCEDYEFLINLAKNGITAKHSDGNTFSYADSTVVRYRLHEGQMTNVNADKLKKEAFYISHKHKL